MTNRAADPPADEDVGRDELAAVRQVAEGVLGPVLASLRAGAPAAADEALAAARRGLADAGLAGAGLPLPVRVEVALVAGGAGSELGARMLDLGEDSAGLLRAALAVGCGQAALRLGLEYAQQREVFGRPLAGFQVQRHAFARAAARLMAAGALVRRAAVRRAAERRAGESRHELDCATALPAACQACWEAVDTALQVHGGYGFCDEFAISRLWLDAARTRAAACTATAGSSRRRCSAA